ncbi:hypothetical protein SAMN05661096_02647 [Marivirga sericea]|uniref:DUF4440 domain-containing protein n=1 Tax=Marivirga sericea TaxID=1028 RepID=A0A1X7KEH6_9BACT|nr:nuclear transport factor 2 family protein [Marivirga sericea]SMG39611.1 hypothetical protein SAMN05661096_02647 [Marivirga sericea]
MKTLKNITIALLLLTAAAVGSFTQKEHDKAADKKAIFKTLENYNLGWERRDVELTIKDYADSTDWTNAFGDRVRTKEELSILLKEVFSLDFVMSGKQNYASHDLTFLSDHIALLRSRNLREGQKYSSGKAMPDRDINHLRVYEKIDGQWKIVSHMISQAHLKK